MRGKKQVTLSSPLVFGPWHEIWTCRDICVWMNWLKCVECKQCNVHICVCLHVKAWKEFSHQSLGLVLVLVVVQLVSSEDEPPRVPGLHETSLLPEPTASQDVLPGRPAPVLRAVARAASLLFHHRSGKPPCARDRRRDGNVLAHETNESVIKVTWLTSQAGVLVLTRRKGGIVALLWHHTAHSIHAAFAFVKISKFSQNLSLASKVVLIYSGQLTFVQI